jgi:2-keto-4-pentenoate hydratase/2-oxohepta-3-ene-1,7-dioic acid hydratase in catechol pathway
MRGYTSEFVCCSRMCTRVLLIVDTLGSQSNNMKYCQFEHERKTAFGVIESVAGRESVTAISLDAPSAEARHIRSISRLALDEVRLLAPVQPSKIVCIGRNYREHAAELGHDVPLEPLIFLKPPSSLLAPGQTIIRPKIAERVDHEGELGVVIGKQCRHLGLDEDVKRYIRGYSCVNDVTARDLQNKDGQWTRAKGFDSFCPVGPIVTDQIDPWEGTALETRVNGEVRQQGNTRDFIFPLDVVIRHISQVMTLLPGDLIATGTPKGVGPLHAGDVVEVTVQGIGTLRNPVADE